MVCLSVPELPIHVVRVFEEFWRVWQGSQELMPIDKVSLKRRECVKANLRKPITEVFIAYSKPLLCTSLRTCWVACIPSPPPQVCSCWTVLLQGPLPLHLQGKSPPVISACCDLVSTISSDVMARLKVLTVCVCACVCACVHVCACVCACVHIRIMC